MIDPPTSRAISKLLTEQITNAPQSKCRLIEILECAIKFQKTLFWIAPQTFKRCHPRPNGDSHFSEPLIADGLEGGHFTLGYAVPDCFVVWQWFGSGSLTRGYSCLSLGMGLWKDLKHESGTQPINAIAWFGTIGSFDFQSRWIKRLEITRPTGSFQKFLALFWESLSPIIP